jgi:hypothetical protein
MLLACGLTLAGCRRGPGGVRVGWALRRELRIGSQRSPDYALTWAPMVRAVPTTLHASPRRSHVWP